MRINRFILLSLLLLGCCRIGYGQERMQVQTDTLNVQVYFRQGYSILEPDFRDNAKRLTAFADSLRALQRDASCRMKTLRIVGTASPEGVTELNERLSEKRAKNLVAWLEEHISLEGATLDIQTLGIDWAGLERLVAASDMPYRDEALDILRNTPVWVIRDGKVVDSRNRQLGMLRGGRAWWYMEEHFFPQLRSTAVRLICEIERPAPAPKPEPAPQPEPAPEPEPVVEPEPAPAPAEIPVEPETPARKPFYMSLKTNMLYDAALVPNLGAEFYLGRGWSIGGNWMYAWWKSDKRHNYWRTYGGELDVRKYFGRRAKQKPLTGHHLGVYGQMLTYDFELGGTGYQSKLSYGAGIEYGYSLPVAKRLNIDFGIGIGYLGGEYKEYEPIDDHYVWQATRQRHWFGPTKVEISLVWLIGRGNTNKGKGGAR